MKSKKRKSKVNKRTKKNNKKIKIKIRGGMLTDDENNMIVALKRYARNDYYEINQYLRNKLTTVPTVERIKWNITYIDMAFKNKNISEKRNSLILYRGLKKNIDKIGYYTGLQLGYTSASYGISASVQYCYQDSHPCNDSFLMRLHIGPNVSVIDMDSFDIAAYPEREFLIERGVTITVNNIYAPNTENNQFGCTLVDCSVNT